MDERPGLNQFRMAHAFLGGFRAVMDAELPQAAKALQAAGGLRLNFIRDVLPAEMSGGWRDGDDCYEWLTGRRTVTSLLGSSTERLTRVVDTMRVFGTKMRRPSSVVNAV